MAGCSPCVSSVTRDGDRHGVFLFSEEPAPMHDVLIALAFLAIVACPAIVTAIPRKDTEDDA